MKLDGSGNVTALNVFAPDGLAASQAGGSATEYVFDPQGNVANRTDSSGNVLSTSQYDAWGNEQVVSGTDSDPFGYNAQSGYYLDRETGVYLCQHRFYDPANARWINRDPIGFAGGTNLYGYCGGGPVGGVDSSGLFVDAPPELGAMPEAAGDAVAEGGVAFGAGAALGAAAVGLGLGYAAGTALDNATGGGLGTLVVQRPRRQRLARRGAGLGSSGQAHGRRLLYDPCRPDWGTPRSVLGVWRPAP